LSFGCRLWICSNPLVSPRLVRPCPWPSIKPDIRLLPNSSKSLVRVGPARHLQGRHWAQLSCSPRKLRLKKNEYIDFDEAFKTLTGSDTPVTDSSESKSEEAKKVRISLLRDWLVVFSAITVWIADYQPARTRDFIAYLKAFVSLASRSGFRDAYEYDRANRRYCSRAGALLAIYKGFLWLPPSSAASTAPNTANVASRKRSRDSSVALQPAKKQLKAARIHDGVEVCWKFNRGFCSDKCPATGLMSAGIARRSTLSPLAKVP